MNLLNQSHPFLLPKELVPCQPGPRQSWNGGAPLPCVSLGHPSQHRGPLRPGPPNSGRLLPASVYEGSTWGGRNQGSVPGWGWAGPAGGSAETRQAVRLPGREGPPHSAYTVASLYGPPLGRSAAVAETWAGCGPLPEGFSFLAGGDTS